MKSVALPFGDGTVRVQLPDRAQVVKTSQPNAHIAPAADEAKAVRAALEQPLGMPRIGELVWPSSRVLIAFDDPTFPSYGSIRRLAIEGVLAELAARGVADEQVTLVCPAIARNANSKKRRRSEMTICPIAILVGCKKCPAFAVCPLKGVIGDYKKPEDMPKK
jgi:nickel-dependent lactate racemase